MVKGIELRPSEELIGVVRRRFLVEVPRFAFAAVWMFSPFFFFFPLISLGLFGVAALAILFFTGCFYARKRYVIWQSSKLLVTTERVIDVDQLGMKKQHVAELPFREIDSVNIYMPRFLGRLTNTGRVQIESASAHSFDLEINGVKNPEHVRQMILDVQYLHKGPKSDDERETTT